MSFRRNPVDEALSASKSLKILETTPTGADFDARVRITAEVSGSDGIYLSIDLRRQYAAVRTIGSAKFWLPIPQSPSRVSFWQMKLGFFVLNFGSALAIRLQDPFV